MKKGDGPATSREKNARVVKNIGAQLFNILSSAIFAFIVPRLFLTNFGSEVNGLVHTVKQILVYLSLLEAGVGSSAQQALYAPVARNDRGRINAIMAAMHHYYHRTGVLYLAIAMSFAFVYPLLVQTGLSYGMVVIIIMLYALPDILRFFLQGKYRIFLNVEGKAYVIDNTTTLMIWVCNILRIAMLYFTDDLLLIQVTYCLPSFVQLLIIMLYIRRHYAWLDVHTAPDLHALNQKNSVLVHQISGIIFNNTDTVLISIVCGLEEASVYTIYMLFFSHIEKIINAFTGGINFRLGQIFHTDFESFRRFYSLYEALFLMANFIIYSVVAAVLLPVITLYTKGVNDAVYIRALYVILFSLGSLLKSIKCPSTQLINYSGSFRRTQKNAIGEMVLNLSISILASLRWGISGCLLGTIVAMVYRSFVDIRFADREILKSSHARIVRRLLVNFAAAVGIFLLIGVQGIQPNGYLYVIGQGLLHACWIVLLYAAVNLIFEWKTLKDIPYFIKRVVKR